MFSQGKTAMIVFLDIPQLKAKIIKAIQLLLPKCFVVIYKCTSAFVQRLWALVTITLAIFQVFEDWFVI